MTKNILTLASLLSTATHAMETISLVGKTDHSLSLSFNGTDIDLIKGPIYDPNDKTTIIVVGNRQQQMVQNKSKSLQNIGNIAYNKNDHCYYKKDNDNDSASDDDTYKPYCPDRISKSKQCHMLTTNSFVLHVAEPSICTNTNSNFLSISHLLSAQDDTITNTFEYKFRTRDAKQKTIYYDVTLSGDEAIIKASNDLALCYKKVLTEGSNLSKEPTKKAKTIILPTLSADVGFPRDKAAPIAIATVFDYIQENPKAYDHIYFFVKKRSDFALYKELLMEYYKPIKAIYLFRFGYFNNKALFLDMPIDVINRITWFTISNRIDQLHKLLLEISDAQ